MDWLLDGRMGGAMAVLAGGSLLIAAACTSWQDETKGLATSTPSSSTASGGAGGMGGGGPCLGCNEFFMASSSCAPPDCPSPDDVCPGGARDALDAFLDCALCGACPSECADECGTGGTGGTPSMSDGCQLCVVGTLTGACASEYGSCSQQ